MSKCNCVLRATDIKLRNGMYTITVSDGTLSNLCACEDVQVGIFTSVPTGSVCNTVEITDGTTTLPVYKIEQCGCDCVADLWQTTLNCRTILCMRYGINSDTLTINDVKGKRGC